jgi:hypothetical protein
MIAPQLKTAAALKAKETIINTVWDLRDPSQRDKFRNLQAEVYGLRPELMDQLNNINDRTKKGVKRRRTATKKSSKRSGNSHKTKRSGNSHKTKRR